MEIWKDIIGYEGLYQISNLGRVKSLSKEYTKSGSLSKKKEKILNPHLNKKTNYNHYLLCNNGTKLTHLLHRLVAIHFIENNENKPQVNHINGIRNDNRIENLEWCTVSENQQHKFSILKYKNHTRNLTDKDAENIILTYKNGGFTQRQLAKKFNSNLTTINRIIKNKAYICV